MIDGIEVFDQNKTTNGLNIFLQKFIQNWYLQFQILLKIFKIC